MLQLAIATLLMSALMLAPKLAPGPHSSSRPMSCPGARSMAHRDGIALDPPPVRQGDEQAPKETTSLSGQTVSKLSLDADSHAGRRFLLTAVYLATFGRLVWISRTCLTRLPLRRLLLWKARMSIHWPHTT